MYFEKKEESMAKYLEYKWGFFMLVILHLSVTRTEAYCNITNNFGADCSFTCHCLNNEQCDFTTGDCSSGCDFEWVGPACQHENIILGEFNADGEPDESRLLVRHSSNIRPYRYSDLAHDTDLDTCSYTIDASSSAENPWWKVWLNTTHKITNIDFITKHGFLSYFRGFSVLVSNVSFDNRLNTSFPNEETCYSYSGIAPNTTTINIICNKPIIGNHIRIKLSDIQTQLVLCDVRVYGECQNKTYGNSCTRRCSTYCEDICDKNNGECLTCVTGWMGRRCDRLICDDQHFGINCTEMCSPNCLDICDKENGTCSICKLGWTGIQCQQGCEDGKYGKNCAHLCSANCKDDSVCNKVNGTCMRGCKAGFLGHNCSTSCPLGYFGFACEQTCGYCFGGPKNCDAMSGKCLNGCGRGWAGEMCDQTCTLGYYGPDCAKKCNSYCAGGYANCDRVYGSCMSGCRAGWMGRECDNVCEDGTYGIDCSYICNKNCKGVCDKVDGNCTSCHSGWFGEMCMLACTTGQWGENCARRCVNCHNETCNRVNGACNGLCKPGFKQTEYCDQECNPGFYGMNCSKTCSPYCKDVAYCKNSDGLCFECVDGWEGFYCEKESEQSGYISKGEFAGLISSFVFVVVIFLIVLTTYFIRRKLRGRKHVSQEATVTYMNTPFTAQANSANLYETVAGKHDSKSAYESLSD